MRSRLTAPAVLLALCALPIAHANSITYTYSKTYTNFSGTDENSFGVLKFDPSLGTLNSVTVTLDGNVTVMGTGTYNIFASNGLQQSSSQSGPFSKQVVLPGGGELLGDLGFPSYRLYTFDANTNGTLSFSSIGLIRDTFVFDYTPAVTAATPEPSSLLLLGTGLVGVYARMRRRSTM